MTDIIGTNSNDVLVGGFGSDLIQGNEGNDLLISRSDAGEPEIAQDTTNNKVYPDQPYNDANDTLVGGAGADTFLFNPLINAKPEIIAKHVDPNTGNITWGMNGVAGENNNTHDHWVDAIGDDIISDYNKSEGDVIQISGHTTEVESIQYVDLDQDGKEESVIQLISNQGGAGAHDGDLLGTITVYGDRVEANDLVVQKNDLGALQFDDKIIGKSDNNLIYGDTGNDTLLGSEGNDTLNGGEGEDSLNGGQNNDLLEGKNGNDVLDGAGGADLVNGDAGNDTIRGSEGNDTLNGGEGEDNLNGGQNNDLLSGGNGNDILDGAGGADLVNGDAGNDTIRGSEGNDTLNGGEGEDSLNGGKNNDILDGGFGDDILKGGTGDDLLLSRSDAGEPDIAQDANATKVYLDQPYNQANDTLTGGDGADNFRFELLINAKPEIAAQHADPITGAINWQAVAGENDNIHDHWVDSIGNDVLLDYNKAEGDKIDILGHTVEATVNHVDANNNGNIDYSLIELVSNQGGAGAHDGDKVGTITVYGDLVNQSDLTVDKMVFYGAFETIDSIF